MAAHRAPKPMRTINLRLRGVTAVVPAVVLAATGVALAGTSGSAPQGAEAAASPSSAPDVPDKAITQPATEPGPDGLVAPGLELPVGTTPGSAAPVSLDGPGIPARALEAYQRAADIISGADPECGIDWALVAAIGRVESDHGRFGGNALDTAGVAEPGIFGIPLDGTRGTAVVRDTDGGQWDHDATFDRAVGPMQFIPGTWRTVGSDADGDGLKNPQDIDDAATATAVYLCSGPGDLRRQDDLYAAIRRYNNSDAYVRTVVAIADAYRHGVRALPASALPAAGPAGSYERAAAGQPVSAAPTTQRPAAVGPAAGGAAPSSTTKAPTPAPTGAVPPPGGGGGAAGGPAAVSTASSVVTQVVESPVPVVSTAVSCVLKTLTSGGLPLPVPTVTNVCTTSTTTRTTTTTITKTG